jgi:hypothetical protein
MPVYCTSLSGRNSDSALPEILRNQTRRRLNACNDLRFPEAARYCFPGNARPDNSPEHPGQNTSRLILRVTFAFIDLTQGFSVNPRIR